MEADSRMLQTRKRRAPIQLDPYRITIRRRQRLRVGAYPYRLGFLYASKNSKIQTSVSWKGRGQGFRYVPSTREPIFLGGGGIPPAPTIAEEEEEDEGEGGTTSRSPLNHVEGLLSRMLSSAVHARTSARVWNWLWSCARAGT